MSGILHSAGTKRLNLTHPTEKCKLGDQQQLEAVIDTVAAECALCVLEARPHASIEKLPAAA